VRATAGRVLEEALSDVFLNGAKPVPDVEADRVEAVAKDLRLSQDVAKAVFAEVRGAAAAAARVRSPPAAGAFLGADGGWLACDVSLS
jgi:hypothetical protein